MLGQGENPRPGGGHLLRRDPYPYDDEAQRTIVYHLIDQLGDSYTIRQFEQDVWELLHGRSIEQTIKRLRRPGDWDCRHDGHLSIEGSRGCAQCGEPVRPGPDYLAGLNWARVPE